MKSKPPARVLAIVSTALMLTSCAAEGPFPSLAPRAIEAEATDASAPAPAPPPRDPAVAERIDALLAKAAAGNSAFAEPIAAAIAATSGAGAAGSERWIVAQQTISAAEAARGPTVDALSELNALALTLAGPSANPEDRAAVAQAVGQVQAIADEQDRRIGTARSALSPL